MQGLNVIIAPLEAAGIPYCIVGGLAAIAYGQPRLTLDEGIVVALHPGHLCALRSAFPPEDFYLPPDEVLLAEMQRDTHGHFDILHQHSGLRADCYLPGKSEIGQWELVHRRRLETLFGECWFSPPEAVVLHKLLFYREGKSEKHLQDIRAMLSSGSIRDREILNGWISKQHLENEWRLACEET